MKQQRNNTARRPLNVSRDAGIVVGLSVLLSVLAVVILVATLPA